MSSYEKEFKEEELYLNNTVLLIDKNLKKELNQVSLAQKELMNVNKYMLSLMIFNHMKENNRQEYWSVIFFNVHYKRYFIFSLI